ncbi:hypothetical protein [Salipaludibacillus daqingensis]|uniref:hypothetical protein n=1 Tax=Salipaludibacillus daqingensis TaxID=3041001 RepID=UPI002476F975|nr:hypothetical protein [Salipaludibacillus daqingensis]
METKNNCPDCGGTLVDDIWETINTKDDGTFTINSYLAKKCIMRCGYYAPIKKEE